MGIEPHLWTDDLPAAVDWYRSVLGFEVTQRHPSEGSATWMQLGREEDRVMIATVPTDVAPNQTYLTTIRGRLDAGGGPIALYLHVSDVDAVHAAATATRAAVVVDIWDAWWGGRQFTVLDPMGVMWTVFEASG